MSFLYREGSTASTPTPASIHSDLSMRSLVEAIVERAHNKRLTARLWSLAELQADEEDYLYLRVWGESLPPDQVDRWLNLTLDMPDTKFTYRQGFGLLFLLLSAEHARREGKMGQIWPDVAPLFSDRNPTGNTRSRLFTPQPFPESSTLEAVREALNVFGLRHDLENKGDAQYWMNSIFLQFGFTRTGIENNLSNWLLMPETQPVAVHSLLDAGDLRHSATLRDFWQVLLEYRHNSISEETAKARLVKSDWLLPDHFQYALKAAKARRGETAAPLNGLHNDTAAPNFLTPPCLRWKDSQPQFYCSTSLSAALLILIPDDVKMLNIYIGSKTVAVLQRQGNGTFSTAPEIFLPTNRPFYEATLEGVSTNGNGREKGETLASQIVALWDTSASVTVYDLKKNIEHDSDVVQMRPEQAYALIIPSDQVVLPTPETLPIPVANHWHLIRLEIGWSRDTGVWLAEDRLWRPVMITELRPPELPEWVTRGTLDRLTCGPERVAFSEPTQVSITCIPAAELLLARFLGRKLQCERIGPGQYRSEPIALTPNLSPSQGSLTLILKNAEHTVSITRPLNVTMYGLAFRRDGEWHSHPSSALLNLEDVKHERARVAVPDRDFEWQLRDGDNILCAAPFESSLFPDCVGLGEALTLHSLLHRSSIVLAPQVVASGEIADVWFGERSRTLVIGVRSVTFSPSHNHKLVWWDFNGEMHFLDMHGGDEEGRMWWTTGYPESATRPRALALAYGETGQPKIWLGLWYAGNWHEKLDFSSPAAVLRTSRRLRWFRLPVLSEEGVSVLRSSVSFDRECALRAWRTKRPIKGLLDFSTDQMVIKKFVLPVLQCETEKL